MTATTFGPTTTEHSRVFGLDLLRCAAILMVLTSHTRSYIRPFYPAAQGLSVFGFLGVELFFVLSGFLIGGIILRTFGDAPDVRVLRTFWVRRWFRTLPNYYLFLVVNELLAPEAGWSLAGYAAFLQNLAWRARAFFNESWSLAVEEWFYLLFPLLLVACARVWPRRRAATAVALAVMFLAATAARVAMVRTHGLVWDADVRKVVVYRLDALMIGVLGAFLKSVRPVPWLGWRAAGAVLGVTGLAASIGLYFVLDHNASFFAKTFYFTLTSSAVFCLLPALDAWRTARGALARAVENVSLWSYSLYLCQLPVSALVVHAFGHPERPGASHGVAAAFGLVALFVGGSIAVSAAAYRWFEKPATNLRERFS